MPSVFLSPSDQVSNTYAYGNTNEAEQCWNIAVACKVALERSGVRVNPLRRYSSLAAITAASDAFGADLHVPIHTNAFNGQLSGTRLFCLDTGGAGFRACQAILAVLAPITPGTSDSIRPGRFYEILYPKAPTAYVEAEFHDVPSAAKWIIQNTAQIGEALAQGICNWLGIAYRLPVPDQEPPPQPATGPVYRVQVGAFRNRENAQQLLDRLNAAGFSGYIRT